MMSRWRVEEAVATIQDRSAMEVEGGAVGGGDAKRVRAVGCGAEEVGCDDAVRAVGCGAEDVGAKGGDAEDGGAQDDRDQNRIWDLGGRLP
eukprot:SAG11_NODE_4177_length_2026_cov_23.795018_2_plen_91_part_00